MLDMIALKNVPQEKHAGLIFSLYEHSTLLESAFPILRIWESHQVNDGEDSISLDEGESRLLVHVRDRMLCLSPLSIEEFKMLTYFSAKMSFEAVCQKCAEEYPSLDIPQLFAECVAKKYLVSFALAKQS
ncbi:MAG: hypothetical protein AB7I18_07195 [Candidatus Berkiella sp.]